MPLTKTFILDWSETGKTVYGIFVRSVDSLRLDDADGAFAIAPADPYVSFAEDSVLKGRYALSEARTVWNGGEYTYVIYKQAGGSPAPVNDTIIGTGVVQMLTDAEVLLDNPANFKANVANLDVAVSTRLVTTGYTAPDNASITAIKAKTDTILWTDITDLHDEALGKWVVDPTGNTLTLYKADGVTVLKTFSLGSTTATVPNYISRTPA